MTVQAILGRLRPLQGETGDPRAEILLADLIARMETMAAKQRARSGIGHATCEPPDDGGWGAPPDAA